MLAQSSMAHMDVAHVMLVLLVRDLHVCICMYVYLLVQAYIYRDMCIQVCSLETEDNM
jgi:hypothetical protein